MITLKRVYEIPAASDGTRILVDRLWPRGLTKAKAQVDLWLKDLGPSTELRKWFGHDPARWTAFKTKYRHELKAKKHLLQEIEARAQQGPVTLLYGAKDTQHNEAVVLKELFD